MTRACGSQTWQRFFLLLCCRSPRCGADWPMYKLDVVQTGNLQHSLDELRIAHPRRLRTCCVHGSGRHCRDDGALDEVHAALRIHTKLDIESGARAQMPKECLGRRLCIIHCQRTSSSTLALRARIGLHTSAYTRVLRMVQAYCSQKTKVCVLASVAHHCFGLQLLRQQFRRAVLEDQWLLRLFSALPAPELHSKANSSTWSPSVGARNRHRQLTISDNTLIWTPGVLYMRIDSWRSQHSWRHYLATRALSRIPSGATPLGYRRIPAACTQRYPRQR
eukprot:SAG11_NODE_6677_length_1268_cov_1.207870_2_plen_277_part_00